MPARITWDGGGEGEITRLDADKFELVSSVPFAPGSRPEATLSPGGERIWMKVHASRRLQDGAFFVEGRLLNATRELRSTLERAMAEPPAPV